MNSQTHTLPCFITHSPSGFLTSYGGGMGNKLSLLSSKSASVLISVRSHARTYTQGSARTETQTKTHSGMAGDEAWLAIILFLNCH